MRNSPLRASSLWRDSLRRDRPFSTRPDRRSERGYSPEECPDDERPDTLPRLCSACAGMPMEF